MPRALALSPHLDDAVFSCGGTLARLADEGVAVTVATLLTRTVPNPTGFALACQLDKGLDATVDYMALRRAEDERACAVLGVQPEHVDGAEAPHRGYGSAAALFGPLRDDDDAPTFLARAIADLLAAHRPDLLLAPQAIGGHVDHVATVRALDVVAPAIPVLWWRDFPYVARGTTARMPFEAAMASRRVHAMPVDLARKERAAACYASQLGYQFGGAEGLALALARAGATEEFRTTLPEGATPLSGAPARVPA